MPPARPKIYHIVHADRLGSIAADGRLWCDAEIVKRNSPGTTIGMSDIKKRRLGLPIPSHQGLMVGSCVPFYFCPRSIMLYLIYCANHPELSYRGGQSPIVHLEIDLERAVAWANQNTRRWAFTLSNAGAFYFESRSDLRQLGDLNWSAIQTNRWAGQGISPAIKEGKQAEFLIEFEFPWSLVEKVGVISEQMAQRAFNQLRSANHRPPIEVKREWYY